MNNQKYVIKEILRHILLLIFTILSIFPLAWLIRTSFGNMKITLSSPPILFFKPTLVNYSNVLKSEFTRYLLNSAIVSIFTVIIVMILGSLAGYALARFNVSGREGWFFYLLSTRMGPPVAFALPYYVIFQLLDLYDTKIGLIIMYSVTNIAFAVWMTRSFFEDLPVSLEEAAMTDGLSRIQAFIKIILPLAKTGLIATSIFVFILSWNEFFYASVLIQNKARTFTTQLPNYITFHNIRWEEMAAASTLGILPVLIFAFLVRRNIVRGFTFGQLK